MRLRVWSGRHQYWVVLHVTMEYCGCGQRTAGELWGLGGTLQCRAEGIIGEVFCTGLLVYISRLDAERMVQGLSRRAVGVVREAGVPGEGCGQEE